MSVFEDKTLSPMLIGRESQPFDSPDYFFELKLDGVRGLAYLGNSTELRNKRNLRVTVTYPELAGIHEQVSRPCVLDGEIAAIIDGKPQFSEMQRRSILSDPFKIRLAAAKAPVCFTAFDILWLDGEDLTDCPIQERKELLAATVRETPRLAVSRMVEEQGRAFYRLTEEKDLEGIVAKRRDSLYYPGKRTKDWIKIKNLQDEDFVVCGYIKKPQGMTSLVLGQYRNGELIYKGHVTLGVSGSNYRIVTEAPKLKGPPFTVPSGNEDAVWVEPVLVCTVQYMVKSATGSLRQPVFKGLRDDKPPQACIECC